VSSTSGPEETRTPYLLIANEAFNQLNFRPVPLREIPLKKIRFSNSLRLNQTKKLKERFITRECRLLLAGLILYVKYSP
jgi:hypothetical protein